MKQSFLWLAVGTVVLSGVGCARVTTQVVEKPRVDQELQGNRGFLKGTAPSAAPSRKQTRKIIQMDVELATAQELTPWKVRKAAPESSVPPVTRPSHVTPPSVSEEDQWEETPVTRQPSAIEPAAPKPAPAPETTTYVVQKGDTLEKIASKVYGDSSKWYRIYKANKDKLSSPNRVYPGQKIVIPPLEKEKARRASSSSDGLK